MSTASDNNINALKALIAQLESDLATARSALTLAQSQLATATAQDTADKAALVASQASVADFTARLAAATTEIARLNAIINNVPPVDPPIPPLSSGSISLEDKGSGTVWIHWTKLTPKEFGSPTWSTSSDPYVFQTALTAGYGVLTNIAYGTVIHVTGTDNVVYKATFSPPVVPPVVPPVTTGRYHIEGKNIIDPTGKVFLPKGVNLVGPHIGGAGGSQTTAGSWNFCPTWGINTIRLNTNPWGTAEPQNNDLDGLIAGFTSRGIVVILDLHSKPDSTDISGTYLGGYLGAIGDWWVAFATKYKDNSLVWFNLMNEAGYDSNPVPDQWRMEHETLIQRIRAVASNIIVCTGAMWGQDAGWSAVVEPSRSAILTFGPGLASRYPNLLFDLHLYDQWGQGASKVVDFINRVQALNLALVIGEVTDIDYNGISRRVVLDAVYANAPKMGVGILPWHGQAQGAIDGWYAVMTNSRYMGDVNSTTNPTNLTYMGQAMWKFGHS